MKQNEFLAMSEFLALCKKHTVLPELALEIERVQDALKKKDFEAVDQALTEEC